MLGWGKPDCTSVTFSAAIKVRVELGEGGAQWMFDSAWMFDLCAAVCGLGFIILILYSFLVYFHCHCRRRRWRIHVIQVDDLNILSLCPLPNYSPKLHTQLLPVGGSVALTRSAWPNDAAVVALPTPTPMNVSDTSLLIHHRYPLQSLTVTSKLPSRRVLVIVWLPLCQRFVSPLTLHPPPCSRQPSAPHSLSFPGRFCWTADEEEGQWVKWNRASLMVLRW